MKNIHHQARARRTFRLDGFMTARDENGHMGFTRLHDKGHLIASAAMANVLRHAAAHRHIPRDHAIYIDRVRKLRKSGTWL
jgi:molybdenum cofactor biosynthesis enzyme